MKYMTCKHFLPFYMLSFHFLKRIFLLIFRGRGRERERKINVRAKHCMSPIRDSIPSYPLEPMYNPE